ncbi:MAG: hypothetical protein EAX89_13555 [Candidatus Lokiarchaeota archaeon]|nr:hypothetical protein [Candidatus Lokiarchaeota archaeon]
MSQIIEKQPFCKACADINIDLEGIILDDFKKAEKVIVKGEKVEGRGSIGLYNRAKMNATYLEEISEMNNYKANLDRQALSIRKFMI